jgi:hypothetical protein
MKATLCLFLLFTLSISLQAQLLFTKYSLPNYSSSSYPAPLPRKLYERNYGAIVGLQRGNITSIELGGEMHWRKIAWKKPTITGASADFEYNFGHHVLGYKVGMWQKTGRVNLTYGGNLVYYTNFHGLQRYGLAPAVGFRFAGFHLINGYNILLGDKEMKDVNKLYITLRYFFPVDHKFTWDRATMRRKRQHQKEKENGERWDWHKPFRLPKKKE